MINPAKYIREVRQETGKVTWPTRREVVVSTVTVVIMVIIASAFFMVVDAVISNIVEWVLGLG